MSTTRDIKPMPRLQRHNGSDKRRTERKPMHGGVTVTDAISQQDAGRLGNLSENGLMLIGSQAPRHNGIRQLSMTLPGIDGTGYAIEVGVQAMWHRQAANLGSVWAGYRIISIDADATAALNAWLAHA